MKRQTVEITDKLQICKRTRKIASDSLYKVLKKLLLSDKPISEVTLRDAWLKEMQKNKNIFSSGWYDPPPHGMIVLFGDDNNIQRFEYKNARQEETWPKKDVFLNREKGVLFCYSSPVDKKTGIIGDFGITLYFGNNQEIKNLLKCCLKIDNEIFTFAHVGMTISEVTTFADERMKRYKMVNQIISVTDKGNEDIGHSIPACFDGWTSEEEKTLSEGRKNWSKLTDIIRKKRFFVSTKNKSVIKPGFAFTIEPRSKIIDKPQLPANMNYHTITLFKQDGTKELLTGFDELFTLTGMSYMIKPMKKTKQKITYAQVGDNYDTKDPIKIHAQKAAAETGRNLLKHGFVEFIDSRGESAYIWKQGSIYMAAVAEQLGTKNLVADETRKITGKTYYDIIANDTVATIINDLVTVGAQPLVIHAYWAIENNDWLQDEKRMTDLINGWKMACDSSGASWGGGETPTLKGIIEPNTVALGGSAIGIISSKKRLLTDKNIKAGDRILFLKSNGINANGLSLSRAIAKKLPKGYATKLKTGEIYGEAILTKTNLYAKLIQDLLDAKLDLHYISNITGHGLRKVMRARQDFTYVVENIYEPQELFLFMQKHANLSDYEMYDEFNMGQDYAIFLPEKDVKKAQKIVTKNGFESLDAGYVEKGERQVIIKPKNITYKGETLQVRL